MQNADASKKRFLISRAGQLCYAKNKLLAREGELLANQEIMMSVASKPEESTKKSGSTSRLTSKNYIKQRPVKEEEPTGNFKFMPEPEENLCEEVKAIKSEAQRAQTAPSTSESPKKIRLETKVIDFHKIAYNQR